MRRLSFLVAACLAAHAAVLLRDYRIGNTGKPFVYEGGSTFTRDRTRLAGIARDRYFEVSVVP